MKKELRGSLSFIKSKNDDLKLSINKDNKIENSNNFDPVPVRESIILNKIKSPKNSVNGPLISARVQDMKIPDVIVNNDDNDRIKINDVKNIERENSNTSHKSDFIIVTNVDGKINQEEEVKSPSKSPKKDKNKNNPKAFTSADRELLDRIRAQELKGGHIEKRLNR